MGSGAYFMRTVWWEKMWRFNAPGKRHDAIVRDKITLGSVLGVVVAATAVLGAFTGGWLAAVWLPVKLFVVPFLLFAHIIGWTVYVHHVSPEIRWWTRREWTQFKGQMESTTVLRMPRLVEPAVVPQHLRPRAPPRRRPHPLRQAPAGSEGDCRRLPEDGALVAAVDPPVSAHDPGLQALRLRGRALVVVLRGAELTVRQPNRPVT